MSTAQSQPELSTLVAAIQAANLVQALSNPTSPLTVFAPTNDAFTTLIENLETTAEDLLANTDLLTDVSILAGLRGNRTVPVWVKPYRSGSCRFGGI